MIDKQELSESELMDLKKLSLERRKEQLEQELEDIKLKQKGLKNGKKSLEQIEQYFKE